MNNDNYAFKHISDTNSLILNKKNERVASVNLCKRTQIEFEENRIENFKDFSLDTDYEWKCYKIFLNDENKELFVFEGYEKHLGDCVIEIAGTDVEELEKIISNFKKINAITLTCGNPEK
jgi:hypothetical protein